MFTLEYLILPVYNVALQFLPVHICDDRLMLHNLNLEPHNLSDEQLKRSKWCQLFGPNLLEVYRHPSLKAVTPVPQRETQAHSWQSDTTGPLASHLTTIYHSWSQENRPLSLFLWCSRLVCTCFAYCHCGGKNNQSNRNSCLSLPPSKHKQQFDSSACAAKQHYITLSKIYCMFIAYRRHSFDTCHC